MSLVLSVLVVAVVLGLLYRHGHAGPVFTEPILLAFDVGFFMSVVSLPLLCFRVSCVVLVLFSVLETDSDAPRLCRFLFLVLVCPLCVCRSPCRSAFGRLSLARILGEFFS